MYIVWFQALVLASLLRAGSLLVSPNIQWTPCVRGCRCQTERLSEKSVATLGENATTSKDHLYVVCTRGHNISLPQFLEKLFRLNFEFHRFREVSVEGLLIPTFSPSSFLVFSRLEILNLRNNRISRIASLASDALATTDVSIDAATSEPGADAMASTDKGAEIEARLVSLDLRSNNIREVGEETFKKMKRLRVLNLGSNNLHSLSVDAFIENRNLRELHLQDNFIMTLPQNIFDSLTHLKSLDLSRNQVFYLHDGAFSSLRELRYLKLSSNFLTLIPRQCFSSLPHSASISIQNNPFQCACGIEWLLSEFLANRYTFDEPYSIRCASPSNLADQPLISLFPDPAVPLPCDPPSVSISGSGLDTGSIPGSIYESMFGADPETVDKAVVLVRGNAELSCNVKAGMPRPSLLWELPSGKKMAVPHAHHISQQLINHANITDFRSFQMKPLDSEHTISVAPPGILHLTDFRFPFAGNYTCHALSPAGNSSASITVEIQSAVWKVYISSLFICFGTVAVSIILAASIGLIVLLVTHYENKRLQLTGLDGTPPIYPTPEESPQLTHRLLTIPVNAAMFENIRDGYDSLRSKIKTGLDKRMEKGRLLVELAWVSGETAITGLREGTSSGILKIDHVVRESGVAFTRGIREGGAAVNRTIRESSAVVSQAVYDSVSAVKDNVKTLKDLCGGVPTTASICGDTPAIENGELDDRCFDEAFIAGRRSLANGVVIGAVVVNADEFLQESATDNIGIEAQVHRHREDDFRDFARVSKVNENKRSKLKNDSSKNHRTSPLTLTLNSIAEDESEGGGGGVANCAESEESPVVKNDVDVSGGENDIILSKSLGDECGVEEVDFGDVTNSHSDDTANGSDGASSQHVPTA